MYTLCKGRKMKGGDKHCKRGQLAIAAHYAAFIRRERRYFEDAMDDISGEVNIQLLKEVLKC